MILSRVFNSSASSWQRIFTDLGVGGAASSPESAEKLGAVAAAHRIFTNSLAALPWQIRRKVGEDRTEAEHDISGILKYRANEYMTPYICEKAIYSYAFWHGTGYAYIDRRTSELSSEDGRISGLIPLPIEPEIYVDPVRGVKWYRFTLPEDNVFSRKISRSFEESQLFIYRFETYDGSLGRGILDIGRETLDTDIKAMKFTSIKIYCGTATSSGIELGVNSSSCVTVDTSGKAFYAFGSYALGRTANPWKTLYIGDSASLLWTMDASGLIPSSTTLDRFNIGSDTKRVNKIYGKELSIQTKVQLGTATTSTLGFFGTTPVARQTVSSTATVATLITALKKYGLIA